MNMDRWAPGLVRVVAKDGTIWWVKPEAADWYREHATGADMEAGKIQR